MKGPSFSPSRPQAAPKGGSTPKGAHCGALSFPASGAAEASITASEGRTRAFDLFGASGAFNRLAAAALATAIALSSVSLGAKGDTPEPVPPEAPGLEIVKAGLDDLLANSPSAKALYEKTVAQAKAIGLQYQFRSAHLPEHVHGRTTLVDSTHVDVAIDLENAKGDDAPIVRVIAHELKHLDDLSRFPKMYMNLNLMEQRQGISYQNRTLEVYAFKFQDIAYAEYLTSKSRFTTPAPIALSARR